MFILELSAVLITMLSVVFAARKNNLTWITGIIGSILFGIVFYKVRLYSDMILQIVFIVTSIMGIISWKQHGKTPLPIMSLKSTMVYVWLGIGVLGLLIGTGMSYTKASLPYWDALILVGSIVAQLLLVRRAIESWHVWIGVDILSIGVYLAKGLYLTAAEYVVFLIICISGLISWKRVINSQAVSSSGNSIPFIKVTHF